MDTQHQQQEQAAPQRSSAGGPSNGDDANAAGQSGAAAGGPAGGRTERQGEPQPELALGTRVGGHVVGQQVAGASGRRIYLVEVGEAASAEAEGAPTRLLLQLLPEGASEAAGAVEAVVSAGLQHPRLLAPRERIPHEGRVYLLLEGLPASSATPRVAAGERLSPTAALRAAAGLADALGYLHRSGLAHLRVSPETIVLQDERAYLLGLEQAVMLDEPGREGQALIADDANALARAIGALAGVAPGTGDESATSQGAERSEAEDVLGAIVTHGAAGEFNTPDELAAAAGQGLLATPRALPPPPENGSTRLRVRHATATTVGKVRTENQDAAAAVIFNVLDDAAGPQMPAGVLLVADGMGGEAHGELASRIAARVVPSELLKLYVLPLVMHPALAITNPARPEPDAAGDALAQAMVEAVAMANRQVRNMADYYRQDTGSTLTALAISGSHAILAHLGDSRAYLSRAGELVQLTEDHTLLARLQAMDHPILSDSTMFVPRNYLYRSLGQEQAPPDIAQLTLAPGDRLMICSDGLWDEVDDATIARELATGDDPARIAERLVDRANEAGGHDNSTALVLFVEAAPEPAAISGAQAEPPVDESVETSDGAAPGEEGRAPTSE